MRPLLLFLFLIAVPPLGATPPEHLAEHTVRAEGAPDVVMSFDHYATNEKMLRSYISKNMIKAMERAGKLKFDHWDVSALLPRLTSILSMHTHSRSTSQLVRKDMKKAYGNSKLERVLHTKQNNVELVVFCHRERKTIKEIIIFRFRDDYCGRIFQITGNLSDDDLMKLMKFKD